MSALPCPRLDVAALMDTERRLYRLEAEDDALCTLRIEAWVAEDALDEPGRLDICCLADGREHRRGGLVDMAIAKPAARRPARA